MRKARTVILVVLGCLFLLALGFFAAVGIFWVFQLETPWGNDAFVAALIAIWGIEAAIVGVVYQPFREMRKNKSAEEEACARMLLDLQTVFEDYLFASEGLGNPGCATSLSETFTAKRDVFQRVLTEPSMKLLKSVVDSAQDPHLSESDSWDGSCPSAALIYVHPNLKPIAITVYGEALRRVGDWRQVLNRSTHALIDELAQFRGRSIPAYEPDRTAFLDLEGKPVIEFDPMTDKYKVYKGETLLCDGTIDYSASIRGASICDGYVNTREYIGEVHEGRRNGHGISKSLLTGETLAEGEWLDDELIQGVEFNWLIVIPQDASLEQLNSDDAEAEYDYIPIMQQAKSLLPRHYVEQPAMEILADDQPFDPDDEEFAARALERVYLADMRVSDETEQPFNIRHWDPAATPWDK